MRSNQLLAHNLRTAVINYGEAELWRAYAGSLENL
jgi:hypothetical protein